MQEIERDGLLTASQIAERLCVKPGTVLGWYRMGRIPARRLGPKTIRFSLPDVVAALEVRLHQKEVGL